MTEAERWQALRRSLAPRSGVAASMSVDLYASDFSVDGLGPVTTDSRYVGHGMTLRPGSPWARHIG